MSSWKSAAVNSCRPGVSAVGGNGQQGVVITQCQMQLMCMCGRVHIPPSPSGCSSPHCSPVCASTHDWRTSFRGGSHAGSASQMQRTPHMRVWVCKQRTRMLRRPSNSLDACGPYTATDRSVAPSQLRSIGEAHGPSGPQRTASACRCDTTSTHLLEQRRPSVRVRHVRHNPVHVKSLLSPALQRRCERFLSPPACQDLLHEHNL